MFRRFGRRVGAEICSVLDQKTVKEIFFLNILGHEHNAASFDDQTLVPEFLICVFCAFRINYLSKSE